MIGLIIAAASVAVVGAPLLLVARTGPLLGYAARPQRFRRRRLFARRSRT
ncbi:MULTISPECIES: hypothetical protein [Nocardiopsis]|uniref:Uncharacterized protein n=1 Tax=Nocardiopsis changdeensis TaxID=2831969 RepID=A0ABX8BVZ3_9ACTN|nr:MULTISPECIES: hypothetical protein [Nocardiopsis]QUX26374.1 hypothetical protein KGD84_32250 [Nocardiopsis changdeensis]QYX40806.1 hypothetical protein K1J57_32925 [Nocardiopsis sp. MT53]